jgi:hypothetical protein
MVVSRYSSPTLGRCAGSGLPKGRTLSCAYRRGYTWAVAAPRAHRNQGLSSCAAYHEPTAWPGCAATPCWIKSSQDNAQTKWPLPYCTRSDSVPKLYLIYQEYAKSALAAQPDRPVSKKVGFVSVVDEAFTAWLNAVVATTAFGRVLQVEIEGLV